MEIKLETEVFERSDVQGSAGLRCCAIPGGRELDDGAVGADAILQHVADVEGMRELHAVAPGIGGEAK